MRGVARATFCREFSAFCLTVALPQAPSGYRGG